MARLSDALDIAEPGGRTGGLGTKPKPRPLDVRSVMEGEMNKVKRSAQENSLKSTRKKLAQWENNWETSIDDGFNNENPQLTQKKKELFSLKEKKQLNVKSNFNELADVIIEYEGFKANAYDDYKQISIGYGSKASSKNQTVTEEKARQMLIKDIDSFYKGVLRAEKKYKYNFTENQRLALTMFAHNNGLGEQTKGKNIKGLKQLLNEGKRGVEEISNSIELYNKAGGKVLQGLVDRRAKEYEIFNYGFNKEEE